MFLGLALTRNTLEKSYLQVVTDKYDTNNGVYNLSSKLETAQLSLL